MKLWDKGIEIDKRIERFTIGNDRELDIFLAPYDVTASKAHANMLVGIGILSRAENKSIQKVLSEIETEIKSGDFVIEAAYEDVHSKLEAVLVEKLGDVGKKIHTARSRNDQVLVALHLYFKAEIQKIAQLTHQFFELLISRAAKHKDVLMPGYTHLQIAMPSSFGLWFSSWAESLIDDIILLVAAFKIADQNPLGSAAGYGSSFPVNRTATTHEMGFATLKYNVIAAQMSRGKTEKNLAMALGSIAGTLSKLAMDVSLYSGQNFNFISLPDQLTTGSSIMPHKKNPDVFELLRAHCNHIQAAPGHLTLIINNLPGGYHRDFQLCKGIIVEAIENTKTCLEIGIRAIEGIKINKNILNASLYDHLFTVEAVNELVQEGMPFRDAYKEIARRIDEGSYKPDKKLNHTHEGSIGNLCLEEIKHKMKKAFVFD